MLEEYFGSSSTLQRNERVKLAAMFWNIVGAGMLIGGVAGAFFYEGPLFWGKVGIAVVGIVLALIFQRVGDRMLYRVPEIVTRGRFPDGGESDSTWRTRRLVMSAPTPLRQDFAAPQDRGLARETKDEPQARRRLALAAIYDRAARSSAGQIGGRAAPLRRGGPERLT